MPIESERERVVVVVSAAAICLVPSEQVVGKARATCNYYVLVPGAYCIVYSTKTLNQERTMNEKGPLTVENKQLKRL